MHEFAMKVSFHLVQSISPFAFCVSLSLGVREDILSMFCVQLAGATYMEVHEAGGGIHFTVAHTRSATQQHLLAGLQSRLERMMRAGTTLVECKSGYGLEMDTELKMLRVINSARKSQPIGISATYCGAHAVPKYTLFTKRFYHGQNCSKQFFCDKCLTCRLL